MTLGHYEEHQDQFLHASQEATTLKLVCFASCF